LTDLTEKLARELILSCKGDPDMMVQPGTPQVYGTPQGDAFAVTAGAAVPLWKLYQPMARKVLAIAREVDAQDKIDTITSNIKPVGDIPIAQNLAS